MADEVFFEPLDAVFAQITTSPSVRKEISDYFTYESPGAKFQPAYRSGFWDGKIRLFKNNRLYVGLGSKLQTFCEARGYTYRGPDNPHTAASGEDIDHFLRGLNFPPKFQHRDYQIEAFRHATGTNRALFLSPTACQDGDDLVLMSDGNFKKIRDIRIGDYVSGRDGKPRKVLNLYHGHDEMYRLTTFQGRISITVTENHVLSLFGIGKKDQPTGHYDITVSQYIAKSKYWKHLSKALFLDTPIETSGVWPSRLSPYFFGVYLGDGHTHSCMVTTADQEIVDALYIESEKLGLSIRKNTKPGHKASSYYFSGNFTRDQHIILNEFEILGLRFRNNDNRTTCEQKFIPLKCFQAPINDRLELLAGLIDADGHLANGTYYEFSSKSRQLIADVQSLSIGLGFRTSSTEKTINGVLYYRLNIIGEIDRIPCRVRRKTLIKKPMSKNPYHAGFDIQPIGRGEFFGIEVEDHYYVTNGGMITHNSGKSLMIYNLYRFRNVKTLLIVPTVTLVHQMAGDFIDYGYDPDNIHTVTSGVSRWTDRQLTISTWQSAVKMLGEPEWWSQFQMIIGDEAHRFAAKSLVGIMELLKDCHYRYGFTGSLDESKCNAMTLEGLFGPVHTVTTTRELMDAGHVSNLAVNVLILKHPAAACKLKRKYPEEVDFLIHNRARNNFMVKLALHLEGNTLLLYHRVKDHGPMLYQLLKEQTTRPIHFVHGKIDGADREQIRHIVETQDDAIIVASVGTFSTGINIKRLHNIITGSSWKSRVMNLQSIGRGLRLADDKDICNLYDITDDLSWKKRKNYTLLHGEKRIMLYNEQDFDYHIEKIELEYDY